MTATRKKAILAGISGVLLLSLLCLIVTAPRQPAYHGKKLRAWLDILFLPSGASPAQRLEAENAVRAIGQDGLPWLVGWLKAEDSPSVKAFTQRYYGVLLHFGIGSFWRPAVDHNVKAAVAFKVLGRQADPAIPELVAIVTNAPDVGRALQVLNVLCEIGSEKACDAVMSLESSRPKFTRQFLKSAFLARNPEMSEYANRKMEQNR